MAKQYKLTAERLDELKREHEYLKTVMSAIDLSGTPAWITLDKDALKITFERIPQREELDPEFKEQLVIEYYSK